MTTKVQEMSWDVVVKQEGCEIAPLSSEEVAEVTGGWWLWLGRAFVGAVWWIATHPETLHAPTR